MFLCLVAALGGILFGYDTAVISGTTADVSSQFGLDDISKGWYVGCALIGSIIGVAIAGLLSDFLGRKKTMLIAAVCFTVSAIGCCVCVGFTDLVAYRIIGGLGIGIISIVSPIYISEVSPAKIRGTIAISACGDNGSPAGLPHQFRDTVWQRFRFLQSFLREDILNRDVEGNARIGDGRGIGFLPHIIPYPGKSQMADG